MRRLLAKKGHLDMVRRLVSIFQAVKASSKDNSRYDNKINKEGQVC
jgi:hypothetical protein